MSEDRHTLKEMLDSLGINAAIDQVVENVIGLGLNIAGPDLQSREGPMNGVLIAEGVLGRILAAFAKSYGGGEQQGLDDLLEISHRHIESLAQHAWDKLDAREAEAATACDNQGLDAPDNEA